MDRLLEALSRARLIPRKDVDPLKVELSARPTEAPADHAKRVVGLISERYDVAPLDLAELLVTTELESTATLQLLTPVIRVLLVEDNPADMELTRRALLRQQRFEIVGIVSDGLQALSFLRRDSPYEGVQRPDLVLLDLDLPRCDGFEVLREIKADRTLDATPVIVLSGTTRPDGPQRAFETHAVSFIRKPSSLSSYRRMANQLEVYWSQVSALP